MKRSIYSNVTMLFLTVATQAALSQSKQQTKIAAGHENGGGTPYSIQFILKGHRIATAIQKTVLTQTLISKKESQSLVEAIKNTRIRLSSDKLFEDGGEVMAMPEKDPKFADRLRIAVHFDSWKTLLSEGQIDGIPIDTFVLHEYLRVIGLGEQEKAYALSIALVDLLNNSGFSLSIPEHEVLTVPTSVYTTVRYCEGVHDCEEWEKMKRDLNRIKFEWHSGGNLKELQSYKTKIESSIAVLATESIDKESEINGFNATPCSTCSYEIALEGLLPGTFRFYIDTSDLKILGLNEKIEVESSKFKKMDYIGRTPTLEAFRRYQLDFSKAYKELVPKYSEACSNWLKQVKESYGAAIVIADCGIRDLRISKDSLQPLDQIKFSSSAYFYLKIPKLE